MAIVSDDVGIEIDRQAAAVEEKVAVHEAGPCDLQSTVGSASQRVCPTCSLRGPMLRLGEARFR